MLKCISKVQATSTAKEADIFSDYITNDLGIPIINTGLIDRYVNLWGHKDFTNKGTKYKTPRLDVTIPEVTNRRKIYTSPKIVFAKLALNIEAFYDSSGEFASINTNCVHELNENYNYHYLLALLNSELMSFVYSQYYRGLRMSKGYFQYQAPQLRLLPIKKPDKNTIDSIAKLVESVSSKYKLMIEKNAEKDDSLKKIEDSIDAQIYQIYGISLEEIKLIKKEIGHYMEV